MILLSGDKDAIYKLEEVFRDLSKAKLRTVRIDQLDFIIQFNNVQIKALLVPKDIGLIRQYH